MKATYKLLIILLVLFSQNSFSQFYTDTIAVDFDASIRSASPNNNYKNSDSLMVEFEASDTSFDRTFLNFNISSLPKNAIIVNATLRLFPSNVITSVNNDLYIERIDEEWFEDSVTWNNQPGAFSADQVSVNDSETSSTTVHEFEVTSHLQEFLDYQHLNFGWRIRLQSEIGGSDFGLIYHSSEYDSLHLRPQIEVTYMLPPLIDVDVKHCSNGNADGEATISIEGGSQGLLERYQLRKRTDTSYILIQAALDPEWEDLSFTNLDPGFYEFWCFDSIYAIGSYKKHNYEYYKWFLVGEEGETITVNCSAVEKFEDAKIGLNTQTNPGGMKYSDINYESNQDFGCSYAPPTATFGYNVVGLVWFKMDFDSQLKFESADFMVRKHYYYNGSISTNEVDLRLIKEFWKDSEVTWNTRPTVDSLVWVGLPTETITGYGAARDTMNLLPLVEYWQMNPTENFGVEMSHSDYSSTQSKARLFRDSGFGVPVGPFFQLTFTVKPKITSEFDDSTGLGKIVVQSPDTSNSYKYLLSFSPLPELDTIWNNLKDSINIDSTAFYHSGQIGQSITFDNLEAEEYFVGIYDMNGVKVKEYTTILSSSVDLLVNDNLTFDETGIEASTPSGGRGSFEALFDKNSSGGMQLKVENFGDLTFGLVNANDTIAQQVSDFAYAMNLDAATASLRLFEDGTLLGTFSGATGDKLRIEKENYDIKFYQNDLELFVVSNSPLAAQDLRVDVDFTNGDAKIGTFLIAGKVSKLKIRPAYSKVVNTECGIDNGTVTFYQSWSQYYSNVDVSFSIIDVSTQSTYAIGTINSNTSPSIPLPVGEYIIQYSSTSGQNWSETVFIGSAIEWQLLNSYFSPINNSVNTLTTNSNYIGNAISNNLLPIGDLGWVEFNHKLKKFVPSFNGPYNLIGLPNLNVSLINSANQDQVLVKVTNLSANILNRYVTVYNSANAVVGQIETFSNGPLRIELENNGSNEFHVYNGSNPISIASFVESGASDYKVSVKGFSSTIYNTYTSFCKGTDNSSICGHLSYELDGNYYVTKNGKFCFVYNEEYNDYEIEFNIYNDAGNIIATQDNFTFTNIFVHGENRVTLDLSQSGYCIGQGFFILEVINDKKEKFYLRLRNDNSGCTIVPDADNDI